MRWAAIIAALLLILTCGQAAAEPPPDYAKEIQQTVGDWAKQQLVDTVKGIFKTKDNKNDEADRVTFGVLLLQIGFVMGYGWLVSFLMPDKIASLMRTTAAIGCLQYAAEYAVHLMA